MMVVTDLIWSNQRITQPSNIFLSCPSIDFAIPGRPNYHGVQPSEANYIKPRKKPLSAMSPTFVFRHDKNAGGGHGTLCMALGASGGPKVITSVLVVE